MDSVGVPASFMEDLMIMARQNPKTKQVLATISLGGQDFPFRLHSRPISLGSHGTVQYSWMDSSDLRTNAHRSSNVRNSIAHWWAAMQSLGLDQDYFTQFNYVLANCYPLIARNKSLQDIYRDAYLGPRQRSFVQVSIPEADRFRLNEIVQRRDSHAVREELNRTLNWFRPPEEDLPELQTRFEEKVRAGIVALERDGNDGLQRYVTSLEREMLTIRRR